MKKVDKSNMDVIRTLPIKELAMLLVRVEAEEDIDYDWDENPYIGGILERYKTSDGEIFWEFAEAVEHECWWLKQQSDEPFVVEKYCCGAMEG